MENRANPDTERRRAIQAWRTLASMDIDTTCRVESLAGEFASRGVKPMDALHVASAIEAGAAWFLTTDRALLRKTRDDDRLKVVDPVDFIRYFQGSEDEN
ncbi:PIN domain-containing protein [Thioalkalicoccus limnaeus]|uniref:PIN domain-containing protein n=1 Tax=Thioalkalicoccus limnaeus TaxID=120681 RepID=A0ABV4BCX0_9GAMM